MSMFHYESDDLANICQGSHSSDTLYVAECKHTLIQGVKGSYPQLCGYEKEWLIYAKEHYEGGTPSNLEYQSVIVNPQATVENAIPFHYKRAILKGSTKYRDIDTGEVLDAFEDGRNLELVSVKMPVFTTTGFNLFDGVLANGALSDSTGNIVGGNSPVHKHTKNFIKVNPNVNIGIYYESDEYAGNSKAYFYDKNKNYLNLYQDISSNSATSKIVTLPNDANICYMKIRFFSSNNIEVKPKNIIIAKTDNVITAYENYEYKTNILTVNEDVTLRSNGDVYDELNLLTGRLTQRIDENNEVLAQEVVKTVALSHQIKPYEGTNHYQTSSETFSSIAELSVPVVSTGEQTLNDILTSE